MAAQTASHSRLVSVKMMHLPLPLYTVMRSFRTLTRDSGDTWHAISLHTHANEQGSHDGAISMQRRSVGGDCKHTEARHQPASIDVTHSQ